MKSSLVLFLILEQLFLSFIYASNIQIPETLNSSEECSLPKPSVHAFNERRKSLIPKIMARLRAKYSADTQRISLHIPWRNIQVSGWPIGVKSYYAHKWSSADMASIDDALKRNEISFALTNPLSIKQKVYKILISHLSEKYPAQMEQSQGIITNEFLFEHFHILLNNPNDPEQWTPKELKLVKQTILKQKQKETQSGSNIICSQIPVLETVENVENLNFFSDEIDDFLRTFSSKDWEAVNDAFLIEEPIEKKRKRSQ